MTDPRSMKRTVVAAAWLAACGSLAWAQWGMGGAGGIGGWGGMAGGTGGDPGGGRPPERVAFRPWLSANGFYSQSLGQPSVEGVRRDFRGYGAAGGVSGARLWERTVLAGFYTANYQRSVGDRVLQGASQVGGLTVSHQATDRVGLFATQFAGSSLGGFGYGAPAGLFGGWGIAGSGLLPESGLLGMPAADLAGNELVDNEVFSTRVNFYGTSGGVSYRPTMRWSMSGGAQAAFVRRKGRGLRDLNTAGLFGGTSYQLSQRTAVGGSYGWSQFSYPKLFGDNQAQFVSVFLQHQVSPLTTVSIGIGGFRMDTKFLGAVAVDPEIAALLGVGTQLEVQRRTFYGWQGEASVSRRWREWGLSLAYMHGANPGNGVMLASKRDSVFGSAARSIGRASFGVFGGYFRWRGLIQDTKLESGSFGASTGFRIVGDLFLGLNAGQSAFQTPATDWRWQRFVSAHLTWSPSGAAFRF